jgi:ComF family protein
MNLLRDLFFLVFPEICAVCGNSLWKNETILCTSCNFHLPRTNFHTESENQVNCSFWGRARTENAGAYLYFNKGNKVQKLIHQLKYKGRRDVGVFLGRQYGLYLKERSGFRTVDCIIPVPLHIKKMKSRGYNQSEAIADGLGQILDLPVDTTSFKRSISTETQTRKSRFRRWENVADIFTVSSPETLTYKHILLVDDVITTGATIESCVNSLLTVPGIRISVVAIAIARG